MKTYLKIILILAAGYFMLSLTGCASGPSNVHYGASVHYGSSWGYYGGHRPPHYRPPPAHRPPSNRPPGGGGRPTQLPSGGRR